MYTNVCVVYKDTDINGSFLSLFEIANFTGCDFIILERISTRSAYDIGRIIKRTINPNLKIVYNSPKKCYDIVITNFGTICSHYNNLKFIQLIDGSRKIICIDSMELSFYLFPKLLKFSNHTLKFRYLENIDIFKFFFFKKIKFVFPSYYRKYISWPNIYYCDRKIDFSCLKIDSSQYDKIWYYIEDLVSENILELKIKKKFPNAIKLLRVNDLIFSKGSNLIYYKRGKTSYFEQFGRLVFERIFLDIPVFLLDDYRNYPDVMAFYLNKGNCELDHNGRIKDMDLDFLNMDHDYINFLLED